ncbi:MAG: hypothetical protein ACFB9M_03985 [Myxococcota bacterium]
MCRFEVEFGGTAEQIVSKAQQLIEKAGGNFEGNAGNGRYVVKLPLGQVSGEYVVSGSSIGFNITKKPMMVPCSVIETYLRGKISG